MSDFQFVNQWEEREWNVALENMPFQTPEQVKAIIKWAMGNREQQAEQATPSDVTPEQFGGWIDDVTGNANRDPKKVAGRALEELTELCLEIGLTHGEVLGHVGDAWHNQCLKVSLQEEKTVWPSQLHQHVIPSDVEAAKELADTRLTLIDLQHLIDADEALIQRLIKAKAEKLYQAHADGRLRFTGDTFYIVKDHVK